MVIFKLLFKLLVLQFYKQNVAFFLFSFIFFFGIISPGMIIPYHLSIIHSEINSFIVLSFVIAGWLFYNLKCVAFFETVIIKYRQSFLFEVQSISKKKFSVIIVACHLAVFLPVFLYAVVVTIIACQHHKLITSVTIIISVLMMILMSSFYLRKIMVNLTTAHKFSGLQNIYNRQFIIPYYFYTLFYILNKKKVSIFILKLFSFALFYLVFTRLSGNIEKDSFINILILIGYFHSIVLFQTQKFLEEKCSFIRNLPLSIFRRTVMFFTLICIIYLPEIIYLFINRLPWLSVSDIIILYLFMVSQLMLYTSVSYISNFKLKIFLRWVFIIAFAFVFLNKLINAEVLIGLQLLVSYSIFKFRYFNYEHENYSV